MVNSSGNGVSTNTYLGANRYLGVDCSRGRESRRKVFFLEGGGGWGELVFRAA